MELPLIRVGPYSLDGAFLATRVVPVCLLVLFWCWETWRPFFGQRIGRLRHAVRNLAIALVNTVIVTVAFGAAMVWVANWAVENQFGALNRLPAHEMVRFALALVLLDGWMYVWHRANHAVPWLWRFHRMHHSDPAMDVTTATRFHLGEQVLAASLRLGLVPLLGIHVWHLVVYDALMLVIIQLHHADISLGRWDRWLRGLIVTPDMHKVHHSNFQPETDSNYSTVLSVWDRLARTFRMRADPHTLEFGLKEFPSPEWQTWRGLWITPFASAEAPPNAPRENPEPAE